MLLSTVLLTGCNNENADSDSNSAETTSTTVVTEEISSTASGQSEQPPNDEKSSNGVRENDEGDIIVIAPETSEGEAVENPEQYSNDDDFQIVTEAPIELPFVPAG